MASVQSESGSGGLVDSGFLAQGAQTVLPIPIGCGPPTAEVCNGLDDNCDGVVDEGSVCASGSHDLAVTDISVPKKVTLRATKPSVTDQVTVQIENRGNHTETISEAQYAGLVSLTVNALNPVAPGCAVPTVALELPKKFPMEVESKKTVSVLFNITYDLQQVCDPDESTSAVDHDDYSYFATVHHNVIGATDDNVADDSCPRVAQGIDPNPDGTINDTGCVEEKTDIVVK